MSGVKPVQLRVDPLQDRMFRSAAVRQRVRPVETSLGSRDHHAQIRYKP